MRRTQLDREIEEACRRPTADAITDRQIRQLRDDAASAGDYEQLILCGIALDEYSSSPERRRRELEGHAYAAVLSPADRRHLSTVSVDEARAACARAIDEASAARGAHVGSSRR